MLELPHTVVGAAIAAKVGNPALALPLAFASHFILDMVPHWNPHLNTEIREKGKLSVTTNVIIVGDILLSLVGGLLIASTALPNQEAFTVIILGALMGVLPDALEAPYFFLGWKYPFVEKLLKFQKVIQNDANPFLGLATQVLTIIACFWWIFG